MDIPVIDAKGLGAAIDVFAVGVTTPCGRVTTAVHPRGVAAFGVDPPAALAGLDAGAELGPLLHEDDWEALMLRKSASLPRLGEGAAEAMYADSIGAGTRVSRRRRSCTLLSTGDVSQLIMPKFMCD